MTSSGDFPKRRFFDSSGLRQHALKANLPTLDCGVVLLTPECQTLFKTPLLSS